MRLSAGPLDKGIGVRCCWHSCGCGGRTEVDAGDRGALDRLEGVVGKE